MPVVCTDGRNFQQQHSAPVREWPDFLLHLSGLPFDFPRSLCGVTQHVHGCFTKGSDRDGHREDACLCLDDSMHKQVTNLKLLALNYPGTIRRLYSRRTNPYDPCGMGGPMKRKEKPT